MPAFDVIGLLYTRTCPLACAHCIIESSPKAKDKMQFNAAVAMLPVIAQYAPTVCFTGGEPLLYHKEILLLIRTAKQLGLRVHLVSGAGWVRKREIAEERVAELKEAGLDKLCISADRYHEAYNPRERAHLLTDVAQRAGLAVMVRGVIPATLNACEERKRFAPTDVPYDPVPLVRLGAARNLPEEQFHYADTPPKGRCRVALSPVIEPDGSVYACCGPSRFAQKRSPLVLGNINDEPLDSILARGSVDPILQALTLIGPYGLLELLKKHPEASSFVKLRDRYTGICELCMDLTDSLEAVASIRNRLADSDAQMLLAAAKLWSEKPPASPTSFFRNELSHAAELQLSNT